MFYLCVLLSLLSITQMGSSIPLLYPHKDLTTVSPPSSIEDIPDLAPELDNLMELEKRDAEELTPFVISSDLLDILPELPRTDRKPRLQREMLLSARQQVLPYI